MEKVFQKGLATINKTTSFFSDMESKEGRKIIEVVIAMRKRLYLKEDCLNSSIFL